ncbi:succinate dehydrogenase cytochrome b subunit [Planctomycetota bacterium]
MVGLIQTAVSRRRLLFLVKSSVGKKAIMSLTGLCLFLFVAGHLAGNLLMYLGPEQYNRYAHALASNPFIVPVELVLLTIFLVHVTFALLLTVENRSARPTSYVVYRGKGGSTLASRNMFISGTIILTFLALHVAMFKYGAKPPPWPLEAHGSTVNVIDFQTVVISAFGSPLYVLWYAFCVCVVGLHVSHGFGSLFRSLGLTHPLYTLWLDRLGVALAVAFAVGFSSIPILAFLGLVTGGTV